jgi:2-methylcitrate dehydratase PrpD
MRARKGSARAAKRTDRLEQRESFMSRSVSEQLAEFAIATEYGKLPNDVISMTKHCFLDWLGSAVAGSGKRPTDIMAALAKELGGNPEATLIPGGFRSRTNAPLAALVNGAATHVVEMDDLHMPSVFHPAAPIVPAALAVAEREGSSGEDLIAAMVVGYEVGIRLGEAAGPSHYRFWHTTATCGTFAAAAAAGRLLGLSEEQLVWALGSAGTQAAGLFEFLADGAMSKQLHAGKAAMDGMLAALLAQKGFTGARRIVEGDKGFLRATAPEPRLERLGQGLGAGTYRISENSFKAHAACYHAHSSIDAALAIRSRHALRAEQVNRVSARVTGVAMDLLGKVEAKTPYAAKFNLPFCIATALAYGSVGVEAFTEARLADPVLQMLVARVRAAHDPALDAEYPDKWPAVLEVETMGGQRFEARVDHPKGDPRNPMTPKELVDKFHVLTREVLGDEKRSRLVELCLGLEQVPTMSTFFDEI